MPAGFGEEQKNYIKKRLMSAAREDFSMYGYKKMNIRELTGKAGIALGTFYKFFKSKEDLVFRIIIAEGESLEQRIRELANSKKEPEEIIMAMTDMILEELENNKLLEKIILNQELDYIYSGFTSEQLNLLRKKSIYNIRNILNIWIERGLLKNTDTELAADSIRSVFFLHFHKNEIGPDKLRKVVYFLIKSITCKILYGEKNE